MHYSWGSSSVHASPHCLGSQATLLSQGKPFGPSNRRTQIQQVKWGKATMHGKQIKLSTACFFLWGLTAVAQRPGNPPAGTQDPRAVSRSIDAFPNAAQTSAADIAGEQVLQGCVSLQGGRYVLQRSRGETVTPAGDQDLSAHVGHTVALHGNYAPAGSGAGRPPDSTTTSPGSSEPSSPKFVVTKIDVVSETCSIDQRNPGAKPSSPKSN